MTAENRVLRRAHRAGNRDDVALQLEVELQLKEQVVVVVGSLLLLSLCDSSRRFVAGAR